MTMISRRAFVGASVGGLSLLRSEGTALAALQCAPIFPPHQLTIDCSVANSLNLFLRNEETLGVVGLVCVKPVRNTFAYGKLLMLPSLKTKPTGPFSGPIATSVLRPIGLPLDEQFCVYGLQAPSDSFIGFSVDTPVSDAKAKLPRYTNVDQIGGGSVSIDWLSVNLNQAWFAGSRLIPGDDECNGKYWRALIVDGLRRASAMPTSAC